MGIITVDPGQVVLFGLVMLRVGAILMALPLFDSTAVPVLAKIGLVLAASLILFPALEPDQRVPHDAFLVIGLAAAAQVAVGVVIGMAVRLVFAGIQMAGQLAGFQMGIAIANVLDPTTSEQVPLLAQYNQLLAMLLFVGLDAHHVLVKAMVDSFELVPLLGFSPEKAIVDRVMILGANLFVCAVQVGAPVIVVLLLTNVSMGLIARTVPQMHVFAVGTPVSVVIGMLFFGLSFPYLAAFLKSAFQGLGVEIFNLLKWM
jgi:flagellar biosynthetic protein FliR